MPPMEEMERMRNFALGLIDLPELQEALEEDYRTFLGSIGDPRAKN